MMLYLLCLAGSMLLLYFIILLLRFGQLRRMAWRNVRRQKQSLMLIFPGLALSTALIAMTLFVNSSLSHNVEDKLAKHFGPITYDMFATHQPSLQGLQFDQDSIQAVRQAAIGEILPITQVAITYMTKDSQGEAKRLVPFINTIGFDWSEATRFDPAISKLDYAELQPNEVILSSKAADSLKARAGDYVYVLDAANKERKLKVSGIAEEGGVTGYLSVYRANASALVSLATARELIGISGPKHTNILLTDLPPLGWNGEPVRDNVKQELTDATSFLTTIIGIVSINAIIIAFVLMISIFRLIAEERQRELGILQAIAFNRTAIRRLLTIEGLMYSIISGFIGGALGWLLSGIILWRLSQAELLSVMFIGTVPFRFDPVVFGASAAIGLFIMFVSIQAIAGKLSKRSIIHTMQADPKPLKHSLTRIWMLVISQLVLLTLTIMLAVPDIRKEWITSEQIPLAFGVALIMIPLIIILIVNLLPFIGKGITAMFQHRATPALVLNLAFRHLTTNRFRTGLLMFMFASITFFICFLLIYSNSMDQLMRSSNSLTLTGGHELAARDWRPLDTATVKERLQASPDYDRLPSFQIAAVQQLFWWQSKHSWGVFTAKINGMDHAFADSNEIKLWKRDSRFATDREAWQELAANDETVILALDARRDLKGKVYEIGDMYTIQTEHASVTKKVIAIAENSGYHPESYSIWTNYNTLSELAPYRSHIHSTLFIKLEDPSNESDIETIKRALYWQNIYPVTNIVESENSYYKSMILVFKLLQNFNLVALFIGGIGSCVIMYRLIRQRSPFIGMMRAIGVGKNKMLLTLLLECFLIGGFGITLGYTGGTYLGRITFTAISNIDTPTALTIPYWQILIYYSITLVIILALCFIPARKALRISPTEATRMIS